MKKYKHIFLILIFLFYTPNTSYAIDVNPLKYWQTDMQWNVEAIYKNIDGNWSEPRTWHFKVVKADESHFEINITSETGSPDAQIFIDRESGQINRILLTEIIKGKSLKKRSLFRD